MMRCATRCNNQTPAVITVPAATSNATHNDSDSKLLSATERHLGHAPSRRFGTIGLARTVGGASCRCDSHESGGAGEEDETCLQSERVGEPTDDGRSENEAEVADGSDAADDKRWSVEVGAGMGEQQWPAHGDPGCRHD
jgi:hypothetical protein